MGWVGESDGGQNGGRGGVVLEVLEDDGGVGWGDLEHRHVDFGTMFLDGCVCVFDDDGSVSVCCEDV